MTIALITTLLVCIMLCFRMSRPYWCYSKERNTIEEYVRQTHEADVDDSPTARISNYGVVRTVRFVRSLQNGGHRVFLVDSQFFRGGYREHDRIYLISVDCSSQNVVKCVAIDG